MFTVTTWGTNIGWFC